MELTLTERLARAKKVAAKLKQEFPQVDSPLLYKNAHELLFAVILSAQCTDELVNRTTPQLFACYKTVQDFAEADLAELTKLVASVNYYKTKAKNIKAAAAKLVAEFDEKVPAEMEQLLELPGIGRKSANVVLSTWFGKNLGFVVDTHVKRIAWRTRLTEHTDPVKIELNLLAVFPRKDWRDLSLRMIFHGRSTCKASRKPGESCSLGELCDRL